jgi:tRNA(fMet)-specific endonuclease VapC
MGTLIDTSVLVTAERGEIDLLKIASSFNDDVYISVVTVSEMLHGLHRADGLKIRERRSRFIEGLLDLLPVMSIDLEIAREHSRIWAFLAMKGNMIGMNDAWLAATCTANDLIMATSNMRDFERVPDLNVKVWPMP